MENQKRKAEVSRRFEELLKKVKALEEEIMLSIKEPDETGETYETQQGDDAADIVADDDENEVSQNEDGTGNWPYLLGCSTTNNPLDWPCYTRSFTCYTEYVLPSDDDKENFPQGITAEGKEATEPQLDEETLKILGDDPRTKIKDLELPSGLTVRWEEWLKSGITKEIKQEILKKYSRQGNIQLEAPTLNQELMALLNDAAVRRDKDFLAAQNLWGMALSSLGSARTKVMYAE